MAQGKNMSGATPFFSRGTSLPSCWATTPEQTLSRPFSRRWLPASWGGVYHASARGIQIEELALDLERTLDLHGFLGISENVRPGYDAVKVNVRVKSPASDENLRELWKLSQGISPVLDMIRNPVPVAFELERLF